MPLRELPNANPRSIGEMDPARSEGAAVDFSDVLADLPGFDDGTVQQLRALQSGGAEAPGRSPESLSGDALRQAAGLGPQGPSLSGDTLAKAAGITPKGSRAAQIIAQNPAMKPVIDGFVNKLIDRTKASMGRNTTEQMSILRSKYGKENVVKDKEGNILYRADKNDDFRPFDGDRENMLLDVADLTGDLIEGIVSGAGEAFGAIAGAGGGPVGSIAGYGLGGAVGTAAGMGARAMLAQAAGGQLDKEAYSNMEYAKNTGLNLALTAGGKIIGKVGGEIVDGVKGFFENSPMKTIEKVSMIMKSVDDMARAYNVTPTASSSQTGDKLFGLVQEVRKTRGTEIGLYKQDAINLAGNRRFQPTEAIKLLKETLDDARVSFDSTTGRAVKAPSYVEVDGPPSIPGDAGDVERFIKSSDPESIRLLDDTRKTKFDRTGGAINSLIDEYNGMLEQVSSFGGYDIGKLDDMAQTLGNAATMATRGEKNRAKGAIYTRLSGALADDKNSAIESVLQGTPMGERFAQVNKKYADQIDDIRKFEKMFLKGAEENGELFLDKLVMRGNATRLQKLQDIVGAESDAWKAMQASYLDKTLEKLRTNDGVLEMDKYFKHFKDLGDDVRRYFYTDEQYRKLRSLSQGYDRLNLKDALNPNDQNFIQNLVTTILPAQIAFITPAARAKAAYNLLKSTPLAADYLVDRGYIEMAKKAGSKLERDGILKEKELLSYLLGNSKKTEVNGKMRYLATPMVANILRTMLYDGEIRNEEDYYRPPPPVNLNYESTGDSQVDAFIQQQLQGE